MRATRFVAVVVAQNVTNVLLTYERVELALPAIVKKNGSRVEYSHDKLASSLKLALRKRPVSSDSVDESIARIEEKLLSLGEEDSE
jgi:transcriptional repressor NrdR